MGGIDPWIWTPRAVGGVQAESAHGEARTRAEHDDDVFRDHGLSLALVILIMFAISLGQTGISYTMAFGALRALLPRDRSGIATRRQRPFHDGLTHL